MPSGILINVFDVNLTAGVPMRIILNNLGSTDLGFAIYDPTLTYGSRSDNVTAMVNDYAAGADESITYTPANSGRHGLVVFKNATADVGASSYRLIIGDRTPAAPPRLVMQVINSTVDPIQMQVHWDSVTVDQNGAPINVDHYQLYYELSPGLPFPGGWTPYLATTLATVNFTVASSVSYFQMAVTAVDIDGLIVAASPLPGNESLIGTKAPSTQMRAVNGPISTLGATDTPGTRRNMRE
jgi:hypothetical protein